MFRRLLSPRRKPVARPTLRLEALESREVPAVTLRSIADMTIANSRPTYVPVTVTGGATGPVTFTPTSNSTALTAQLITGGRSVEFDVSGITKVGDTNQSFTGTITVRLFESAAPQTAQRIVDLITSGYYTNTGDTFHRVADLFDSRTTPDTDSRVNIIVQGGSPTGNGQGGSSLPDLVDEFHPDFTFASNGLLAMANAYDDNNNAQFFFTDLNRPLTERVEFLNFNHTIVGIITDGFDTLVKMQNSPRSGTTPTPLISITGARVLASDPDAAVLKLTPQAGFSGTATIQVVADDGTGPASVEFDVTGAGGSPNSRAFIPNTINRQLATTEGQSVSFTVPFTDIDGNSVSVAVRNAHPGFDDDFTTAPTNVNVQINQATRTVTLTPVAGFTGTLQFKVGVWDSLDRVGGGASNAGNWDTQIMELTVSPAPPPSPPTSPPPGTSPPPPASPPPPPVATATITAEGSAAGAEGRVTVKNTDGSVRYSVVVFNGFTGGVRAAVGDVNNDGQPDVVAVPGFGGGAVLVVLDGTTGAVVREMLVFEPDFRGGLTLYVGDTYATGYEQITVGAGVTGGPRVTVVDLVQDRVLANFFAGDENSRGGVQVDVAELVPGEGPMLIAALGPTAGPVVYVFDADSGRPVGQFLAGDPAARTGIRVRAGEPDATTRVRPILVAPYSAPPGTGEQPFDPTEVLDLDR